MVNDREEGSLATEPGPPLSIRSKTVLINTSSAAAESTTDLSDYARAEEDLRRFFFRITTETAPPTVSSVYFEPEGREWTSH